MKKPLTFLVVGGADPVDFHLGSVDLNKFGGGYYAMTTYCTYTGDVPYTPPLVIKFDVCVLSTSLFNLFPYVRRYITLTDQPHPCSFFHTGL
jgi:hypothetical protein